METLNNKIEQTAKVAEKILAENPDLQSMSFHLMDFPVEEVMQVAKERNTEATFSQAYSRVGFLVSVGCYGIYIHVYSMQVQAKVVYEYEWIDGRK